MLIRRMGAQAWPDHQPDFLGHRGIDGVFQRGLGDYIIFYANIHAALVLKKEVFQISSESGPLEIKFDL